MLGVVRNGPRDEIGLGNGMGRELLYVMVHLMENYSTVVWVANLLRN